MIGKRYLLIFFGFSSMKTDHRILSMNSPCSTEMKQIQPFFLTFTWPVFNESINGK
jgi:hypothetical protein